MLGNLILETTNAPGTSADCLLAGPATGRLPFSSAFTSGAICFYVLNDGVQSEWGIGTYTSGSPNKLTRTTVLKNSAGTTARLNFLGSTRCYNDIPAEKSLWVDQNNTVTIPGNLAVNRLSVTQTAANGGAIAYLSDPSAAADAKIFDFLSAGGGLFGRAVNDTYAAANNWLTVARSGYVITAITLAGTAINLSGTTLTLAGTTINLNANVVANAAITVAGSLTATDVYANGGALRLSASGAYIYSNASVTQFLQDGGAWRWEYARSSGGMAYIRGYDNLSLFYIDPAGNVGAPGSLTANAIMSNSGTFYVGGNTAYYTARNTNGSWNWVENNTANMTLDGSGNLTLRSWLTANGSVCVNADQSFKLYDSGHRNIQFQNQWVIQWDGGNGDLNWLTPQGAFQALRTSDRWIINWGFSNGLFAPYAGTAYQVVSDERLKTNIEPSPHGLDTVLGLRPIRFQRRGHKGEMSDRVEHGFSAQQVRSLIPEAVTPIDQKPDAILTMSTDAITAALVNSCKELAALNATLAARVSALEARLASSPQ